jgi:hypothetical protein
MRKSDDGNHRVPSHPGRDTQTGRRGMDWLIAGILLILIVAMLVRLKQMDRRRG